MANKAAQGTDLLAYVIDGMIQGVTQQSEWDRRDTQCEAQFDAVNSPVNGCAARPGFDFIKQLDATDHTNSFCYEIFRGDTEHYLVVIDQTASGANSRKLHVYDLNTGLECAVTIVASSLVTVTIASPGVVGWPAHGLLANQPVFFEPDTTVTLPSPFVQGTTYFVKTVADADHLTLSTTSGGTVINTSGAVVGTPKLFARVIGARAASEAYLACSINLPNVSLMATTLEDTTFIGNREVVTAMSTTLKSPPAQNNGILFFRAGGYQMTFQVSVTYNGSVYTWTYLTPDNSAVTNATYISTNALAATFFRSLTGADATPTTSGTAFGSLPSGAVAGVGAATTGDPTGAPNAAVTGSTTLTSLGFTVELNGSCILISRSDAAEWALDTGDGVGNTYLICGKDTIQSFDQLPPSCFSGFTIKVIGTNQQQEDDYFVQFQGADGSSGYWEEVVAPGTPLTFDPTTMPLSLVNTGVGTFDFGQPPWGGRVSGDGVFSALDPSFIGNPLQELAFDNGRLALMWEGATVWSRTKNVFVFFPDSAQTVLDTDPIDIKPGGGKTIALLRRIIQVAETTLLWAEKIQFRATSGVNPFTQATVECPPSTNYEFSPLAIPKPVGQSLYFATEVGAFATLRDLSIQNNVPVGATDVTGHVKKYIPTGVRWITASDTLGMLFCTTLGALSNIFCYNYLLSATARLQSAWNTWRLPPQSVVLWVGMDLNFLFALVQRPGGAVLLKADLSPDLLDADAGALYHTRLDFRVTEAACTAAGAMSYNAATNQTTITMPYEMPEALGWLPTDGTPSPLMVVNRTVLAPPGALLLEGGGGDLVLEGGSGDLLLEGTYGRPRGYSWPIAAFPTLTTILVSGDCTGAQFYAGWRIRSERELSRFYLKTNKGLVPTERLAVRNFVVNYSDSGYFRAEVSLLGNLETPFQTYSMTGRILGDPLNVMGSNQLVTGTFKVPIAADNDKYTLNLVNDSFLPSNWNSMVYQYQPTYIAKPDGIGQSVPSYFANGGSAGYANNF